MCLSPIIILNPDYIRQSEIFSDYFLGSKVYKALGILGSDKFYSHSVKIPFPKNIHFDEIDDYFAVSSSGLVMPLYIPVECGNCVECRNRYAKDLGSRMILEQSCHDCAPFFITLTYNNDNLPDDGCVNRDDVRRFIRSLHDKLRHAGYPHEFRHIFFSEYGSLHGRPHYHGIIFGLDPREFKDYLPLSDLIASVWKKGFVDVQLVKTPSCFKYVSKYVLKDNTFGVPAGKLQNFWLSSRRNGGIGSPILHLFDRNRLKLEFPFITVKCMGESKRVFLPKSIRRKLSPCFFEYIGKKFMDSFKRFCYLSTLMITLINRESNFNFVSHPLCPSVSLICSRHKEICKKFPLVPPRYRILGYCVDDIPDFRLFNHEFDFTAFINEYEYLYSFLSRSPFDEKHFLEYLTTRKEFADLMHTFMVNLLNTITVYDDCMDNYLSFQNKRMFASRTKDLQ